ncbi:hypothetical protein RY972_12380 [Aeromonas allosaccharophila]|uniref:Uncharacterized protein n=1 Tax=Aeromonas allosaccharophila TaxID=656 RepID=A0ABZ0F636_9GAMM|nr:hypothetical protein [Aeromonas allosaccharophila]WOE64878.1 hypothetical protein RY972_12380 [Aeromonas allosaccharophila]
MNHLVILEVAALWGNFNQAGGAKHAIPRNLVKRVNWDRLNVSETTFTATESGEDELKIDQTRQR